MLSLLGTKASDRLARREARRSYVAALTRWGQKETAKKTEWEQKFGTGDIEAGYFLVEYYAKRPNKNEPIKTLEALRRKVPDDYELLTELVKSYRKERRFKEAVDAAPRAREGAARTRARGLHADRGDQDRGAQGRRGREAPEDGGREVAA